MKKWLDKYAEGGLVSKNSLNRKVTCSNCGWSWKLSDSSAKDMYICHECGRDNSNNMKNGGWLDSYADGETMQEHQENYNDYKVSAPKGMVGDGFFNVGRNYSPAWGGQFEDGGSVYPVNYVPEAQWGLSVGPFTPIVPLAISAVNKVKSWFSDDAEQVKPIKKPVAKDKPRTLNIVDPRKKMATTNQPLRPNSDLVGGKYNSKHLDKLMQEAKRQGLSKQDMINLSAMGFQETKWGRSDGNIGHVLGDWGGRDSYSDFVNAYKAKMKEADRLGIKDPALRLQVYNGMGTVTPKTEKNYHGFEMQKIYGVPIPKEGINMKKNPLYGKQVMDIRDNVLAKNPEYVQYMDSIYKAPVPEYMEDVRMNKQKPPKNIQGRPQLAHQILTLLKKKEMGGSLPRYQSIGEVKEKIKYPVFNPTLIQQNRPIIDVTAAPILLPPNLNYDKTRVVNSSSRGLNKTQLKNINQNLRNRVEQEKKQELEEYKAAQLFHNNNPVAQFLGTRSAPVSSVKPTARELAYGLGAGINEFYDIPGIGIVNDFVNPLSLVSKGIISPWAQAPLQAQQSDSYLPYLGAAASTALTVPMVRPASMVAKTFLNPRNIYRGIEGTGRYLTEETALKNAYKYNPWAFKTNPEAYYRTLGKEGLEDAFNSGVIRPKQTSNVYSPELGKRINVNIPEFPEGSYFNKGSIYSTEKMYNPDYIAEVTGKDELFKYPERIVFNENIRVAPNEIPIENAQFYKKDWLQGYKPVDKSKLFTKGQSYESAPHIHQDMYPINKVYHPRTVITDAGVKDEIFGLEPTPIVPLNDVNYGLPLKEQFYNNKINPEYTDFELNIGRDIPKENQIWNNIFKKSHLNTENINLKGEELKKYLLLNDAAREEFIKNYKILKKQEGGAIITDRGQWDYPGQTTIIPSNEITMEGVPYPVIGVDNTGHTKMMQPGMNYTFPGQYVTEYPMMQGGGGFISNLKKAYVDAYNNYNSRTFPAETLPQRQKAYRTINPSSYLDLRNYGRWVSDEQREESYDPRSEEAFKFYLGLSTPDELKYLKKSKYIPTINAVDKNYYTVDPQLEQDIFNSYKDKVKLKEILQTDESEIETPISGKDGAGLLGRFGVSRGRDKQGDYLSYYDRYDLKDFAQKRTKGMPYSIYNRIYYPKKEQGGEMIDYKSGGQHGGLDRWFAEKWVDIKTGKPCGRQEGEDRNYPACRPSKRISSDTPKTSSELSSSEKERFKQEKTSSQRISYNHNRKEYGGENIDNMNYMKSGGNVPTNPELYSRVKSEAKSKFNSWPSAYGSAWLVKTYKNRGGGYRKAEYGMEVMGNGGVPNNPGFNALPEYVQQNIINNMAVGGQKMPPKLAYARFAAAGNLDQLDRYGYQEGGEEKETYWRTKKPMVNDPSMDAISKVLLQRNQDKNFMQRAAGFGNQNGIPTKYIDGENPNSNDMSTLLMGFGDNYVSPTIIETFSNPLRNNSTMLRTAPGQLIYQPDQRQEYIKTPTEDIADYFAAKGYKRAANDMYGMNYKNGGNVPMYGSGGEPDGEMAIGQIDAAINKLTNLRKFIQPNSDLEPWVSSKLTMVDDYANSVSDYMMYNPETKGMMELPIEEMEYGGISMYGPGGQTKPKMWLQNDVDINYWNNMKKKYPTMIGIDPNHVDKYNNHLPIFANINTFVHPKTNLKRLEMVAPTLINPKIVTRAELLPISPKQTVNLTNLIQPRTYPVDIYDRKGNFIRQEFMGDSEGVVDQNYIGEHHYAPRGGNSFIDTNYAEGGGIPERYRNMGFTSVGAKKQSTRPGKKWMVLAKKGDDYKVVHGGYKGMQDFKQHHSEQRRENFWNRMGGKNSSKATDPFSPLYWHKRFGTWEEGGQTFAIGGQSTLNPIVKKDNKNWLEYLKN